MNILFMCRANCFRSRVAEAYFKKINRDRNIKVESAGVISGYKQSDIQINTAKEFGIDIRGSSKGISAGLLKWADFLVIVADDVPPNIFNYEKRKKYIKKIIVWGIRDVNNSKNIENNKRVIKELMKKVDKLNKELKRLK